jgi:cytochrome c556
VWDDPAAFLAAQKKYQESVSALLAVAPGADMPTIKAAAEAVGESCKACHKHFRYE